MILWDFVGQWYLHKNVFACIFVTVETFLARDRGVIIVSVCPVKILELQCYNRNFRPVSF